MADIIAFEDLKRSAGHCEVLSLFKDGQPRSGRARNPKRKADFPTTRPFISGNLGDLYEQANAVAMRYYDGDERVPRIVGEKCLELLQVLSKHAEPE